MIRRPLLVLIGLGCLVSLLGCNLPQTGNTQSNPKDFSGTYCLNVLNLELEITQQESQIVFTTPSNLLLDGSGTIKSSGEMQLSAATAGGDTFSASVIFSEDQENFQGSFELITQEMQHSMDGILLGFKGSCPGFDLETNRVPQFVTHDFINLEQIEYISKFRSGFGHSFTDGFETCRSMKHYYNPYPDLRENHLVEIYAPANGTITSIFDERHGASEDLNNKQVHIRPDAQPAFTIELYHVDLISEKLGVGTRVIAGELLGYGRLYYDDLDQHATSLDIAIRVNTPTGSRLVSYFEVLTEEVFESYLSRGAFSRQDFIISQEDRDESPLECSGESFLSSGELENWVLLP